MISSTPTCKVLRRAAVQSPELVLALAALAIGALLAGWPATSSAQLRLLQSDARVEWGGFTAPQQVQEDTALAEGSDPGLYALSDLVNGTLRASAMVADDPGRALQAEASLELLFQNTGDTAIQFEAGDVRATVSASFLRTLGTDAQGSSATGLLANLSGGTSSLGGYASAVSQYEEANRTGWPAVYEQITGGFGFTATGQADANGLEAELAFPVFSLQPLDGLRVRLSLSAYAAAGSANLGASGWSAWTDAANSAHLAMTLPAGMSLLSPQPLAWVSAVPEPGSALLWLPGLLALAVLRRPTRHGGPLQIQTRRTGALPCHQD